ncbi:MAG TPA: pyrroline-5-carboxylate reductase [Methylocystis sp.]|nr:pyrroline-5-carboxylate reductase [Methylocystis sp.]
MSVLAGATVAVIGAGKMGFAMLSGLARGERPARVVVVEPKPAPEVVDFCRAQGFELLGAVEAGAAPVDALALAIKPQTLDAAAPGLHPLVGPQTLVLSILAGKRVADLSARLPAQAFVRAMPNTPAAIGRGVTGAFASAAANQGQRDLAQALLASLGEVEWIDREELMDVVTAVSGSGPAYVFLLAECLAAAGEAAGLPGDLAMRLSRATVAGAGELLRRSPDVAPSTLRENVTSPGGTTAAALGALMAEDGMKALFERAIAAATRRASELSG